MNTLWIKLLSICRNIFKKENIGKIIIVLLIILLCIFGIRTRVLKNKLNKCHNTPPETSIITQTLIDTIVFHDTTIIWKTYHKKDTIINLDTLFSQDTIIIYQLKESLPDTFYYRSRYKDSIIDVEIFLLGEGILDKTKIDSVVLNYEVHPQYIIKYKNCKRCKRLYYKFCRKCL